MSALLHRLLAVVFGPRRLCLESLHLILTGLQPAVDNRTKTQNRKPWPKLLRSVLILPFFESHSIFSLPCSLSGSILRPLQVRLTLSFRQLKRCMIEVDSSINQRG